MVKPATDGKLLEQLVELAIPQCQAVEHSCPRTGPGRKPEIPDWVLMVMILIAVSQQKKTKSAQWTWWRQHPESFERWMPGQRLPARSTYYDRYRRCQPRLATLIAQLGQTAIDQGWADARAVAVDKSLITARGRPRPKREHPQGRVPKRVDPDATWGISKHDGWVHGYAYEVVVTAGKTGVSWPLLASVDTASRSEQKSFREKIADLPATTRYITADSGYDSNDVAEAVEWQNHRRTGRRMLCPEVPRPNVGRPRKPSSRETRARQYHRRLRDGRRRFFQSPRGRALYARRKVTAEPFHAQFKHLFGLEEHVWHWGLANNRTAILAAIAVYQLLLTYNHRSVRPLGALQCLIDGL